MEEYIKQLRRTYKNRLYYFTLMGTLSLIDICAALNSLDGETNGEKFKAWFEKYLPEYSSQGNITGFYTDECYKFRCRFLHQARAEMDVAPVNKTVKSGKLAFYIGPAKVHMCNFNGVYYLDIETFMNDVIKGVKKWIKDTEDLSFVKKNKKRMIKIVDYDPGGGIGKGKFIT